MQHIQGTKADCIALYFN